MEHKSTDDFLNEAKVPKGDNPAAELKGLLKGLAQTRRAFQAGNPHQGYRAAIHAMWNVARVMRAVSGVEPPTGIGWDELLMDAKVTEKGVKRDCMNEVEHTGYAIQDAKSLIKQSHNGTKDSRRVRDSMIDVLHGLAGTLARGGDLQKDAEKVIDHVERALKSGKTARTEAGYPKPKKKKPSIATMTKWSNKGYCLATDGCKVEPDGVCGHGYPSWMLYLGYI